VKRWHGTDELVALLGEVGPQAWVQHLRGGLAFAVHLHGQWEGRRENGGRSPPRGPPSPPAFSGGGAPRRRRRHRRRLHRTLRRWDGVLGAGGDEGRVQGGAKGRHGRAIKERHTHETAAAAGSVVVWDPRIASGKPWRKMADGEWRMCGRAFGKFRSYLHMKWAWNLTSNSNPRPSA